MGWTREMIVTKKYLTIEGTYDNQSCEAKCKMVIFNSRFKDFDKILSNSDCTQYWKDLNLKCPLCDNPMEEVRKV
ncbi:MAG: hypothetical protein EZS28_044023 [Streblomastix strix]|uniref:Uncharacterized protein n=1 Tax=Streblomastix strix TaxID=222440 RepID=A0A5J4TRB2_9EUKA|nr:MAG: hypothetical protein EZS28_044023 [Streblomastix strix]